MGFSTDCSFFCRHRSKRDSILRVTKNYQYSFFFAIGVYRIPLDTLTGSNRMKGGVVNPLVGGGSGRREKKSWTPLSDPHSSPCGASTSATRTDPTKKKTYKTSIQSETKPSTRGRLFVLETCFSSVVAFCCSVDDGYRAWE
uniref:Uncharacterized protein n=1 Tax=Grammatophora oceanica TaxID=210454 RepID=A0A7S1YIR5_9STRA|mmetsp:Transcript_51631/g.77037  ORF Transcript_51631/g.77037 Transcript_51631/m.77037 type:complete len:142 (+) Transcript_51631:841-1266(+)